MFGGLVSARLKSAEIALREGRIDEAFRLAGAPDLNDQRRARAVLAALTEPFIERARAHFRAERFAEASSDLHKAEFGGGHAEEIAELRRHIATVSAEVRRQEASRKARLDAAKRRVEAGSLAAGKNILHSATESDHDAQQLQRGIQRRQREVRDTIEQIEALVQERQFAAAAQRCLAARRLDAHAPELATLETRIRDAVLGAVRAALKDGRPARAATELHGLGALGDASVARKELSDVLVGVQAAGEAVRGGHYARAREQVLAAGRVLGGAKWMDKAVEQLRQVEDILTALRAGPLGESIDVAAPGVTKHVAGPADLGETVAVPGRGTDASGLPRRLLLLVNGGGSYLVFRGDRLSIGRAASDQPADLALFSDLAERHAHIAKVDEDYFLFASRDVEVGGKRTRHELLRDGDRVVLARRAKFSFRLPSRRSLSAVLDLSDTTKTPHDVRRVVLFERHATIGRGPTAHIRCAGAAVPLVLFERDGQLWVRSRSDGGVRAEAIQIQLGRAVEIGDVSFVVEPWPGRAIGMSGI